MSERGHEQDRKTTASGKKNKRMKIGIREEDDMRRK